jgi:hypothetical protein
MNNMNLTRQVCRAIDAQIYHKIFMSLQKDKRELVSDPLGVRLFILMNVESYEQYGLRETN